MRQFYINKMLMLIFSIIAICLYLYSECLVCRVLKNKDQLSVVASKCSICDMENNIQEFKLCSMLKHSPNGKGMIYGSNGIQPQWKRHYGTSGIYRKFNSPNEKGTILFFFFFEVVMVMLKDKRKYIIKDTMSINISFIHYMKQITVMLPVVFEEFELVCTFLLFFFFTLSLSIGKRSTLAKICPPVSTDLSLYIFENKHNLCNFGF